MSYDVIILAAGKGSRSKLVYNKMFYKDKEGVSILEKSVRAFSDDSDCQRIVVTVNINELEDARSLVNHSKVVYVYGGGTRQDSVYNALQSVQSEHVMIHDGARCYVSKNIIENCKQSMKLHHACVVMVPAIDTMKRVVDGVIVETLVRSELYSAQTPQCFHTKLIRECYQKGKEHKYSATDDTALVEMFSDEKIYVVEGEYTNIKVTTPQDLK